MALISSPIQLQWQKFSLHQKVLLLNQLNLIQKGLRDTVFFAEYYLGIKLNPFQTRVCREIDQAMWGGKYKSVDLIQLLLHAGNRSGKTVLLAILHIKFAYYKIGIKYGDGYDDFRYRTFDISPISRQAKECVRYIETILTGKLSWEVNGQRYSNANTLKLNHFFASKNEAMGEVRYENNSLTYAFSTGEDMGSGFQGLPAGMVTYDECVLSHHLEEELDSNVYSRLGDYGKMVLLAATPQENAHSQQYYYHLVTEAKEGLNNFIVMGGAYNENIFISQEKRDSHVKTIKENNPLLARQIIFGDFVTLGGVMFETQVIEQLWFKDRKRYIEPNPAHEYLISVDWGVADKGDETVMLIWDLFTIPYVICYAYSKQGGEPYELMAILRNMKEDYNDAEVVMDTSSMGGAIFKKLLKNIKPVAFESSGGEEKQNALFYTQMLLTEGRHKKQVGDEVIEDNPNFGAIRSIYLPKLANQLSTYELDDKKLKQDWVSAFYIGCWRIYNKFKGKTEKPKSYRLSRFKTNTLPQNANFTIH